MELSHFSGHFPKGHPMKQTKAFALSIVLVIISFLVSVIAAAFFADFIGVWKKPVMGAVAAFCVVITGYTSAPLPNHKQAAALIWLIVGAISAWFLSGDSYYPEDYEHAYQLTQFPLIATYFSGLLALCLCMVWHNKRTKYNNEDQDKK